MTDTAYTFLDGLIQGPQGPQGADGGAGGSATLISRVRYVDKLTTVEERTGAIDAPFNSIAEGMGALQQLSDDVGGEGNNFTLMIFPGDYSGESPITWNPSYGIGLTVAATTPGGYNPGSVALPELVGRATAGRLSLSGMYVVGGISGGWSAVFADGCQISGNVACPDGPMYFTDCNLADPNLSMGGMLHARGGTIEINSNPVLVGFTTVLIDSCNVIALSAITFSGSPGSLLVDGMTDYLITAAGGCVLTNGTKTVMA